MRPRRGTPPATGAWPGPRPPGADEPARSAGRGRPGARRRPGAARARRRHRPGCPPAPGRGTGRAGRLHRRARPAAPRTPRAPATAGLSRLIELHAFNAAGDAAVAISLAGTLFFQVPTGEARGQVALFLGLTMLPFAIVAPLIGPFLDRFSHGRRWAIGATMALRGVPVLGAGRRRASRRLDVRCSRRRSAAWSRPRRTA